MKNCSSLVTLFIIIAVVVGIIAGFVYGTGVFTGLFAGAIATGIFALFALTYAFVYALVSRERCGLARSYAVWTAITALGTIVTSVLILFVSLVVGTFYSGLIVGLWAGFSVALVLMTGALIISMLNTRRE